MPVVLIFFPLMGYWLTRDLQGADVVSLPPSGGWSVEQKRVLAVFAFTACCWITRTEPFGGWSGFFQLPHANDDIRGSAEAAFMVMNSSRAVLSLGSWVKTT
jgi:sodium-dependent dicarboxylate transporter 2/3/5